ncbi:MAG: hypothetical protein KDA96_02700 [Planctomycetaceae bacterium]|nr:hypothetical protein [Planctomycetaceae bacterium]
MNHFLAVLLFELRRSVTVTRVMWWIVLASLPILVTVLLRFGTEMDEAIRSGRMPAEAVNSTWSVLYYVIVTCVSCTLGVFLNTAPAVATELEQHSWVYMATRPNGIRWLLFGKYTIGVLWAATAAIAGLSVSVFLCEAPESWLIWRTLTVLCILSSLCYGAIYLMIGAIMPKRAMVLCVVYTIFVEIVLGLIPAVVNRLTIQYRLRSLFVNWAPLNQDIRNQPFFGHVFDEKSAAWQIAWLMGLMILFLAAAQVVAHRKEFTQASEGDM